jgi:phage terminase large subunit
MTQLPEITIPVEYKPLFETGWREAAIYGGRYSLKSHTVARYLLIRARQKQTRIGCFREFQNSISESSHQLLADLIILYGMSEFKVTDKAIVNGINGSEFLFKGMHHNEQSIKSLEGLDIAWVEEAQTVSQSSIDILTPTVRKDGSQIIYTYNRLLEDDPVHTRLVIEGRPNTLIINANYDIALKYGLMPDVIRLEMEDDKANRPSLYKHKWLGEPNSMELQIYRDWRIIDEVPYEAHLVRRGLDYGYSNDPSALVDIYEYNGGYIWDEQLYRKGMSNKQLADFILALPEPNTLVIPDSSEPKSNDEIKSYGVVLLPAVKGPDSVQQGIQLVQSVAISVTRRSKNLIAERRNYFWRQDKDGKILNIPIDAFNHAMDAGRYAMQSLKPHSKALPVEVYEEYVPMFPDIGV